MPRRPYDAAGTVEWIVDAGLCTNCGFCEPVCPTDAITMQVDRDSGELLPVVHAGTCVMCPLCLAVCPGDQVDFDRHYRDYLHTDHYDKYFGHIRNAYIGHSLDKVHRARSASGGVLTELAAFALEAGILDYLVLSHCRDDDPLRQHTLVTADPAVVRETRGSVYHPVALGEDLRMLSEDERYRGARLGLIGLPCHIHGAHKLVSQGRFHRLNWHIIFGIFCGGTWSFNATSEFLRQTHLNRNRLARFEYRGNGWPGQIHWVMGDGREGSFQRHGRGLREKLIHATVFSAYSVDVPQRCFTCSDGLAELADISFGDPWLKSERGDGLGKTLVVTRSERAEHLLRDAVSAGRIALRHAAADDVVVSQKGMLTFKQNYAAFTRAAKRFGYARTPHYGYRWAERDRPPRGVYLFAWVAYACRTLGRRYRNPYLRRVLGVVQAAVARLVKRHLVKLTERDRDNYFA